MTPPRAAAGGEEGTGPTGAEHVVQALVHAGVEVCFANPGTSEMHFVGAMDTVPGLRPVLGLHETVCSGAADGYGRVARRPAAALLHLGPGLANALANLHNARRARTPVVVLVGDMATWHAAADPVLAMDVPALAAAVSGAVVVAASGGAGGLAAAAARAVAATRREAAGALRSRVATLVVPHDLAWERARAAPAATAAKPAAAAAAARDRAPPAIPPLPPGAAAFVRDCAAALRGCARDRAALYIGGDAAVDEADGGALGLAGRVAAAAGAALLCENAFSRLDRGAGRPAPRRLSYFPDDAAAELAAFDVLVLVDARRPVANFGYRGGPSQVVAQPDERVWEIDAAGVDVRAVLAALAAALGGDAVRPGVNCGGVFAAAAVARPALPAGRLTPAAVCAVVAALQPEGAVVVDESLTSGNAYWAAARGCPPFSHLALTGGAIGCGPPLAVGAAVAAGPGRVVVNLQADGSAMYSLQALWTQARERLRVVTVVCANRVYAILKVETAKQRIGGGAGAAARALTEIGSPPLDWVALAAGMGVPARRAATAEELAAAFAEGLARQGPTLIEAVL